MSSRDINDLTYELQSAYVELRQRYTQEYPNRDLLLLCTFRPLREQAALYRVGRSRKGRVITNCDGVCMRSKHNYYPARAFDVGVLDNGKYRTDAAAYTPLGKIAKDLDIVWGGNRKKLKDFGHFETKQP